MAAVAHLNVLLIINFHEVWSSKVNILIKKFPEFTQKIQNTSFIHQKWYCPLQSTLHRDSATHLCQRLIQLSKHFWNSIVGIAIRAVFDFSIISFWLLKCVPRNGFLTRSNRKKSQGAKSGEFDSWMIFVSFLVKNSQIMMALCDGALSWCKIHSIFNCKKSKIRAEVDVFKTV